MSKIASGLSCDLSLWLPLSKVAELRGVTRAAITLRVQKLEEQGLIKTQSGKGRTKLVNIAEFDRVVGQVGDLAREQGAATRRGEAEDGEAPAGSGASGAYTREQAKRMAYQAEIARLDLEERLGELVKVAELRPVIEAAGHAAAKAIDSLSQEADALREAALNEDHTVLTKALRDLTRRLRGDVVAAIREAMPGVKMRGEGAPSAV